MMPEIVFYMYTMHSLLQKILISIQGFYPALFIQFPDKGHTTLIIYNKLQTAQEVGRYLLNYALESTFLSVTPSYCFLCFIWAALNSNWSALRATFYDSPNPWRLLPLVVLLQPRSPRTLNPICVSSTHLLAVGIFIHQSEITWGQGHVVSLGSMCGLCLWGNQVLRDQY